MSKWRLLAYISLMWFLSHIFYPHSVWLCLKPVWLTTLHWGLVCVICYSLSSRRVCRVIWNRLASSALFMLSQWILCGMPVWHIYASVCVCLSLCVSMCVLCVWLCVCAHMFACIWLPLYWLCWRVAGCFGSFHLHISEEKWLIT